MTTPRARLPAALIAFLTATSGLHAQRAEIAVVKATTTARQRPSEASGIMRLWAKNIVTAGRAAGLDLEEITDEDVEKGKLATRRLAIFSFNGRMDPEEIVEVEKFVDAGGKVIFFSSLPDQLEKLLGFKRKSSRRTKYDGEAEYVKFDTKALPGAPEKMRQGTWNFNVTDPGPNGRTLGTWMDREGKDTKIPAVAANDKAMWMGHVLTGADRSGNAAFLLAAAGSFLPDIWERSVSRALKRTGHWGAYASLDHIAEAIQSDLEGEQRSDALQTAAKARRLYREAEALAKQNRFPEALDAARRAFAAADLAYCCLAPSREGEFRGIWMHPSIVKGNWDQAMRECADAGLNAVVPVVSGGYYAYYDSKVLPRIKGYEDAPDQLAECIKYAHKHGLEVHAWRVNWQAGRMRDEEFDALKKAGRLQTNYKGETQKWLCPSSDENQALELAAMVEMAENYGLEGIHFDYIRYPNDTTCYCDRCRRKFEQWLERKAEGWPMSAYNGPMRKDYREFRCTLITRLVADVHREARKARPDIIISAAVFNNWESCRRSVGQDWKLWIEKGYVDFVCPMTYTPSTKRLCGLVSKQVVCVNNIVPLNVGIGVGSSRAASAAHMVEQIRAIYRLGADGFTLFCYRPALAADHFAGLRKGVARTKTYPGLGGPEVTFALPAGIPSLGMPYHYDPGSKIEAGVSIKLVLPGGRRGRHAKGRIQLETALGRVVRSVASFDTKADTTVQARFPLGSGLHRLAVLGTVVDREGKESRFSKRGPLMVCLTPEERAELEERLHPKPPKFSGKGVRVGVFADGFGSGSIAKTLGPRPGLEVKMLRAIDADMLAPCQVAIVPQLRARQFKPAEASALKAWVASGGRLMLTHDAVGYRSHDALFPKICRGKTQIKNPRFAFVACDADGWVQPKAKGPHAATYYDLIALNTGPSAKVVARVAGGAQDAVAVLGRAGKGKVFATGLIVGLGPDNQEVAPSPGESALLVAAVEWLAK